MWQWDVDYKYLVAFSMQKKPAGKKARIETSISPFGDFQFFWSMCITITSNYSTVFVRKYSVSIN